MNEEFTDEQLHVFHAQLLVLRLLQRKRTIPESTLAAAVPRNCVRHDLIVRKWAWSDAVPSASAGVTDSVEIKADVPPAGSRELDAAELLADLSLLAEASDTMQPTTHWKSQRFHKQALEHLPEPQLPKNYHGVEWVPHKRKWLSKLKSKVLGYFEDEEVAARVYDVAARTRVPRDVPTNFVERSLPRFLGWAVDCYLDSTGWQRGKLEAYSYSRLSYRLKYENGHTEMVVLPEPTVKLLYPSQSSLRSDSSGLRKLVVEEVAEAAWYVGNVANELPSGATWLGNRVAVWLAFQDGLASSVGVGQVAAHLLWLHAQIMSCEFHEDWDVEKQLKWSQACQEVLYHGERYSPVVNGTMCAACHLRNDLHCGAAKSSITCLNFWHDRAGLQLDGIPRTLDAHHAVLQAKVLRAGHALVGADESDEEKPQLDRGSVDEELRDDMDVEDGGEEEEVDVKALCARVKALVSELKAGIDWDYVQRHWPDEEGEDEEAEVKEDMDDEEDEDADDEEDDDEEEEEEEDVTFHIRSNKRPPMSSLAPPSTNANMRRPPRRTAPSAAPSAGGMVQISAGERFRIMLEAPVERMICLMGPGRAGGGEAALASRKKGVAQVKLGEDALRCVMARLSGGALLAAAAVCRSWACLAERHFAARCTAAAWTLRAGRGRHEAGARHEAAWPWAALYFQRCCRLCGEQGWRCPVAHERMASRANAMLRFLFYLCPECARRPVVENALGSYRLQVEAMAGESAPRDVEASDAYLALLTEQVEPPLPAAAERGSRTVAQDKPKSSYRGVYWNKTSAKWTAILRGRCGQQYLGMFPSELEAAHAYDKAVVDTYGPHADTNFCAGYRAPWNTAGVALQVACGRVKQAEAAALAAHRHVAETVAAGDRGGAAEPTAEEMRLSAAVGRRGLAVEELEKARAEAVLAGVRLASAVRSGDVEPAGVSGRNAQGGASGGRGAAAGGGDRRGPSSRRRGSQPPLGACASQLLGAYEHAVGALGRARDALTKASQGVARAVAKTDTADGAGSWANIKEEGERAERALQEMTSAKVSMQQAGARLAAGVASQDGISVTSHIQELATAKGIRHGSLLYAIWAMLVKAQLQGRDWLHVEEIYEQTKRARTVEEGYYDWSRAKTPHGSIQGQASTYKKLLLNIGALPSRPG
ncbi:hypothetical protein CYMTET_33926 [Cymbomonas tetramitiformis]|uniref:AP2/ERF domain-containing protein n=1 Tax=Cymbomonas tetramitiformis TaxID=36881 RepID=A0AAE0KQG5_9CHLO|nr:hypothetical protein CYMTET_33926 [Cymbomonas tetramitiformis]